MDWKEMINKRVFIRTSYKKFYNGIVLDVTENKGHQYYKIKDKFGYIVYILLDEIVELNVEGDRDGSTNN